MRDRNLSYPVTEYVDFRENLGIHEVTVGLNRDAVQYAAVKEFERAVNVLDVETEEQPDQLVVSKRRQLPDRRIHPMLAVSHDDVIVVCKLQEILEVQDVELPIGVRKKQVFVRCRLESRTQGCTVSEIPWVGDTSDLRIPSLERPDQFACGIRTSVINHYDFVVGYQFGEERVGDNHTRFDVGGLVARRENDRHVDEISPHSYRRLLRSRSMVMENQIIRHVITGTSAGEA